MEADLRGGGEGAPDQVDSQKGRNNALLIHRSLRESILAGEVLAGQEISQVQLADQFNVSRGPVREALKMLERDGLIEAEVNHRARVTRLSPSDLEQIYGMRIVLESVAIAVSVPALTDDDFIVLDLTLSEMEELAGVDAERWAVPHARFHRTLVAYAGERTELAILQLFEHSERYRRIYLAQGPRMWTAGVAEHHEIVDACRARDARKASVLLARHLSRTALTVLMVVAPEYNPALVRASVRQVVEGEQLPA
ncbi:MAG: hypothetical protein QOH18_602 [Solirubrobacterales bacterium]|jgi:DNA-binding GntR family transcriptional regulator|nr:hypothetical protein [Solirubrobacterales bacterium]